MKRTDRIGKHVHQTGPTCMLASWCMAGGYRYSDSRVARYLPWHLANRNITQGLDTVEAVMDRPFKRYLVDYINAYKKATWRQVPRKQMATPEFTGNGTLNMWSRGGICHSVAVIDTPQGHIILDPSDPVKIIYTSYAQYIRAAHSRPTLVTFVEVT